jgi:hypothetical protein
VKPTLLAFGLFCCLYALTAGGQGYSVDGTFSYQVALSLATDPQREFVVENRATLRRWGPVVPLLGVPFTWLGARLGDLAPRPDSVAVDGYTFRLHEWPAIGPAGASDTLPSELTVELPQPVTLDRLRMISFLSLATDIPQAAPVVALHPDSAGSAPSAPVEGAMLLRAGRDTAEWAYDLAAAGPPRHDRARAAGYWPGNPDARLYYAEQALAPSHAVSRLTLRYVAASGRFHLRALAVDTPDGVIQAGGPTLWSAAQQQALFARFGYSFLNAPLMALAVALLIPVGRLLGYATPVAALVALGFGAATMAWPYAKLDFSETAVAAFGMAATVLVLGALVRRVDHPMARRRQLLLLGLAGACAAAAAGAKYTAAWLVPLLAVEVILLGVRRPNGGGAGAACSPRPRRAGDLVASTLPAVAAFVAPAAVGGAIAIVAAGGAPTLWSGWLGGLERGWLDLPAWVGLHGLLLSPGKSLFLYSPPLLLALAGAPLLARRQGAAAFLFLAVPVVYLVLYGTKGVWHGGGWGPRYLVPSLPFAAVLVLPVVASVFSSRSKRLAAVALVVTITGVAVQVLGVAKHPNLYPIMFRDHVLPSLADYGVDLDGVAARAYWAHFGGPRASMQLMRPPEYGGQPSSAIPLRGLGYLYAEEGVLSLRLEARQDRTFDTTLYVCDWDQRGRRQRITLIDAQGTRTYEQTYDFSECEYLTWTVDLRSGAPATVSVESLNADVPVLSGVFFDSPAREGWAAALRRDGTTGGAWPGRYGHDGYALFAWQRGGADLARLPEYVGGYAGGDRVWIDTAEADLADTALLYALPFSPLLAHGWLLATDSVTASRPEDITLQQRLLASPPWRVLAGLAIQPPHPEYGLGLDFWQVLLRAQLRSHAGFMAGVWAVTAALALGALGCAALLARVTMREARRCAW